jgi:hypothetical protein
MRVVSAIVIFIFMGLAVAALNGGNSSSPVASVADQTLRSEDGVNDSDWQRVKNQRGEVAAIIDLRTVTRDPDGNAHARLCLIKDGACPKGYRLRWYFNCRDHSYSWIDTDVLPQFKHEMKTVERGSVADQLAGLVCASGISQAPAAEAKMPPKWQNVPYPNMYDSTRLAFDVNSITVTNDDKGNVNGADVTARVVAGDVSIVGKYMVLSFDCASHYRINHSYPLALSSPTQESFIGNVACGAARCEILRRQEGKSVCNAAAN